MSDIAIICDINHNIITRLTLDGDPPYSFEYLKGIARMVDGGEHAYPESQTDQATHIGCRYNGFWFEHLEPCSGPTEKIKQTTTRYVVSLDFDGSIIPGGIDLTPRE